MATIEEMRAAAAKALTEQSTSTPETPTTDAAAQEQAAPALDEGWRYFQHLYAGATFVTRNGHVIIFGGPLGGRGTYMTKDPDEIAELADGYTSKVKDDQIVKVRGAATMPGSMITELVKHPRTGVLVPKIEYDALLEADQQAVLSDSRANSIRDMDPNVIAARENLPNAIKSGS